MARRLALVLAALAVAALLALLAQRDRERAGHARASHEAAPSAPAARAGEVGVAAGEERARGPTDAPPADRSTITGRVTVDGEPIWCVRIFAVAGDETLGDTATGIDGRYGMELPGDASVVLEVVPDRLTRLVPVRRPVSVAAGHTVTEDFDLARGGIAEGTLAPGPFADRRHLLLAIRLEDFPALPDDPALAADALDAAPRLTATAEGKRFEFRGLDPAATYRLAVDGVQLRVKDAVTFRAGDRDISVQLEIVLPFFSLEVSDVETDAPLPRFSVHLVNESRECGTLEGSMGRIALGTVPSARSKRARDLAFERRRWRLVVAAEGYREEWVRADTDLVLLQREREPNVLLRVEHEDGAPCNDAVSGTFGRQGAARLELDACGRGLFVGTLPPGGWRVTLLAGPSDWDWDEERRRIFPSRHALFLPRRILDIEVPESGMAEPPVIRLPAWGTVELKGAWDFLLESAEGERVGGSPGTYQLPEGTYHVLRNERAVLSFDVVPGETRTVVVPAE